MHLPDAAVVLLQDKGVYLVEAEQTCRLAVAEGDAVGPADGADAGRAEFRLAPDGVQQHARNGAVRVAAAEQHPVGVLKEVDDGLAVTPAQQQVARAHDAAGQGVVFVHDVAAYYLHLAHLVVADAAQVDAGGYLLDGSGCCDGHRQQEVVRRLRVAFTHAQHQVVVVKVARFGEVLFVQVGEGLRRSDVDVAALCLLYVCQVKLFRAVGQFPYTQEISVGGNGRQIHRALGVGNGVCQDGLVTVADGFGRYLHIGGVDGVVGQYLYLVNGVRRLDGEGVAVGQLPLVRHVHVVNHELIIDVFVVSLLVKFFFLAGGHRHEQACGHERKEFLLCHSHFGMWLQNYKKYEQKATFSCFFT